MTPLEIHLLLNLYTEQKPYKKYKLSERYTPEMIAAFEGFEAKGLLREGMSGWAIFALHPHGEHLSAKGMLLVERLMEVQP